MLLLLLLLLGGLLQFVQDVAASAAEAATNAAMPSGVVSGARTYSRDGQQLYWQQFWPGDVLIDFWLREPLTHGT